MTVGSNSSMSPVGRPLGGIATISDCFEPGPCGNALEPGETFMVVEEWDLVIREDGVSPGRHRLASTPRSWRWREMPGLWARPVGPLRQAPVTRQTRSENVCRLPSRSRE